jgi:hypothetical protein
MRRKRAGENGTCGMQVALDTPINLALSSETLSPLGFTRVCHDAWYSCSRRGRAAAHITPPQAGARHTIWVCWERRDRSRLHASKQRVRTTAGKEKDSDEYPKIPAAAWHASPGAVCRARAGWHEAHEVAKMASILSRRQLVVAPGPCAVGAPPGLAAHHLAAVGCRVRVSGCSPSKISAQQKLVNCFKSRTHTKMGMPTDRPRVRDSPQRPLCGTHVRERQLPRCRFHPATRQQGRWHEQRP